MRVEPGTSPVSRQRRGIRRAVAVFAITGLALAGPGCADGGAGAASDSEKAADAEILNAALAEELTAADAYARGGEWLRGPSAALARELEAQAREHADGIVKTLRGLGAGAEAEASDLDLSGIESQADFLAFVYGLENDALAADLDAVPRLETPAPRTLATSLATSHAQHLVVLRQALGAGPTASIPEAFEPGDPAAAWP